MASRRSNRLTAVSAGRLIDTVSTDLLSGALKPAGGKKRKGSEVEKPDKPRNASKKDIGESGSKTEKPPKKVKTSEPKKASNEGFAVPATPKRKTATVILPPSTPTPVAAKALGVPSKIADLKEPQVLRVADPHSTNALLISPRSSKLFMNKPAESASPSKPAALQSKTTTGNILEKALAHLIKTEPKLKHVIEKHHCSVFSPESLAEQIDPFNNLCSAIISQQVSGAAAKSIKAKFVALFNTGDPETHAFPPPAQVATKDIGTLRTAGLSQRKAEYIQGLAEKFASGELSVEMLMTAEYDEVFERLIAVRGLGKWSVEMFACFGLKRMDVFSTGDLGVQRGLAALMGRDVGKIKAKGGGKWKYMSEQDMLEISEKFAPYRSVFMWYCWRVEDVDISTFN